jgi:hypothetical protein
VHGVAHHIVGLFLRDRRRSVLAYKQNLFHYEAIMTAALNNTAQGTPFAVGVDSFVYPQFIGYALRPPTAQDVLNPGTRWQDNSVNPPVIYQTSGAGLWASYTGAPLATTAAQGIVFLATNAQAAAGTVSTNSAIIPSSLAFALSNAASLPIGNTTPGSGAFTTLSASGALTAAAALTVGTTLGVTGASTIAALSATSGTFSTTLGVTGASTFSSGTFSTTLGVTGLTTLAALTQIGATNINNAGSATTSIGVSGGGAVNIGNSTGNTTISGGNLLINGAGKMLQIHHGAVTDFIGTGVLTAGTQTIANTNIATGDVILLTRVSAAASTTLGELTYTISNGASFTVTSLILGTPASTQTGDLSTYAYMIVRPA